METASDKFKRLALSLEYASKSDAPINAVQERAQDLLEFVINNAEQIEAALRLWETKK